MSVHQEIEAKFLIQNLPAILHRLEAAGGQVLMPRTHEYNLRFDTPDGQLSSRRIVLRLRRSDDVRLTVKTPAQETGARVSNRREAELRLQSDDFETARALLKMLGYTVSWIYEKYRRIYRLANALVTADETPLGDFIEIEAPAADSVLQLAQHLGLHPSAASPLSYQALFKRAVANLHPSPQYLTFAAFQGQAITPAMLGLRYADAPQHPPKG